VCVCVCVCVCDTSVNSLPMEFRQQKYSFHILPSHSDLVVQYVPGSEARDSAACTFPTPLQTFMSSRSIFCTAALSRRSVGTTLLHSILKLLHNLVDYTFPPS
jgi:hypothetical protein